MKIKTPITDHVDFDQVYEPAEDSFLLLDALEKDLEIMLNQDQQKNSSPVFCLEIGSGSGIISTGLASVLPNSMIFACDINPQACLASQKTSEINKTAKNQSIIRMDFLNFFPFCDGKIDLLVCNPPYVATNDDELGSSNIYASWAGGSLGRQLTDKLIHSLQKILSEHGIAYIVLEQCNKPQEVKGLCEQLNFNAEFVLSRRAGREYLHVLRLKKQ